MIDASVTGPGSGRGMPPIGPSPDISVDDSMLGAGVLGGGNNEANGSVIGAYGGGDRGGVSPVRYAGNLGVVGCVASGGGGCSPVGGVVRAEAIVGIESPFLLPALAIFPPHIERASSTLLPVMALFLAAFAPITCSIGLPDPTALYTFFAPPTPCWCAM